AGGFATRQHGELVVARALAELAERLAGAPPAEPACDEPLDRLVELFARHAPEDGPRDRRGGPEPAPQEDVVGLVAPALLVAQGRALEADVADPVLRAGMRAAVQMESQIGDRLAEP